MRPSRLLLPTLLCSPGDGSGGCGGGPALALAVPGTEAFAVGTPQHSPCHASPWVGTEEDPAAVFFSTIEPDNMVFRIDGRTGAMQWNMTTAAGGGRVGVRSSPVEADGLVHIGMDNGTFAALDAQSGDVVWSHNGSALTCYDTDFPPTYFRPCEVYSSALLVGGLRFQGSEDNHTRCFNASTGELLWARAARGNVDGTAVEGAAGTGSIWIGSDGGYMYNLDMTTGKDVLPPVPHPGTIMECLPAVDRTRGVLFSMYRPRDSTDYGVVFALDMHTGDFLWNITCAGGVPIYVAQHDTVVVGGENGTIFAANASTGAVLWDYSPPAAPARIMGPLVYDAGRDLVYGADFAGRVVALAAPSGAPAWTYKLPASAHGANLIPVPLGPRLSADGALLYFGSYDGALHALHLE